MIVKIEQKLKVLENQIYEPTELIDLLLPLITEILILKIEQSKEEVVEAIAPILVNVENPEYPQQNHSKIW
ncbi:MULTISPECIES: hypothetical protein [Cyanophyceae]|uniref:hypothetical protein n=1 Tax=Cyanophyceae TaxID=3028117 RepID=UPI0016877098|nr:hypothetical protein [Trichocoleus sp. FACHB-40]MBD2003486.1 hypothetical protein [Trichocoleus sp. FACHB-40]